MERDIIVIGGGPGGYVAAIRGAQLGAKVTLIEKHKIGGTCLNYGCIPTKTLYKNAEIINTLKNIDKYGIQVDNYRIDMSKIQTRKELVVEQLVGGIEQLLRAYQIEVIYGQAQFMDKNTLKVTSDEGKERQLTSERIIIATGSRAVLPSIEGSDLEGVYTSKEILELQNVPEKLTVIGGGVIGMELAGIYNALGSKVTVVEYEKNILSQIDRDISKRLAASLKKRGMTIKTSTKVSKIARDGSNLKVVAEDKKGKISIEAESVLFATGRRPAIDTLRLENAGIDYSMRGIKVDENFMTNIKGVYAIGDVNGKMMLAHVASHQGIRAIEHIYNIEGSINHDVVPSCIFVFPEIAVVGMTEDRAKERGVDYNVSKFSFTGNGKALAIGEEEGLVKVLSDLEDRILGVEIMGPHASDLIHEGALAVSKGLSIDDITHTIHAHPTLSEAFTEAALGLKGEAIHMLPPRKRK